MCWCVCVCVFIPTYSTLHDPLGPVSLRGQLGAQGKEERAALFKERKRHFVALCICESFKLEYSNVCNLPPAALAFEFVLREKGRASAKSMLVRHEQYFPRSDYYTKGTTSLGGAGEVYCAPFLKNIIILFSHWFSCGIICYLKIEFNSSLWSVWRVVHGA